MSKIWYTTLTVLLATSLVACQVRMPTRSTPTAEAEQVGCHRLSCEGEFTAFTWVDTNADGIYDESEAPLAGVEFLKLKGAYIMIEILDLENKTSKLYKPISNQEGIAHFPVSYAGVPAASCVDSCKAGREKIIIEPRVPQGYRLTTPSRQSIEEGLSFGFSPK
jgi:hypothetical protein